uniref:Probable inorganic carbon transporter subunit DabA n=1 Tax=Schlesneria paludicola TaxID=360056 RepID=A0A7C2NW89_9PLAN
MNALAVPRRRSSPAAPVKAVSLKGLVARAADVVAPVWPLKTFIAVNPLQGLEHLPFEQAVVKADRQRAASGNASAGQESVNRELIKWCAAYFDDGQSTISLPGRDAGLYRAFADLARFDGRLNRSQTANAVLASLPESPDKAIAESLEALGIADDQQEEFLRQGLAALPGWSGYVKWKENWQRPEEHAKRPATLVDYVAVRLVLTRLLWPEAAVTDLDDTPRPSYLSELPVREAQFRDALLQQLLPQAKAMPAAKPGRPAAQLVFCIDVRSEPFRRAVEAQGHYETLGFAGFFGLPVRVKGLDDDQPHDSCPVLLKPRHVVCDHATAAAEAACVRRYDRGRSWLRMPKSFYQWLKYNLATPFALVEMLGPWLGLRMLAQTWSPTLVWGLAEQARTTVMPPVSTEPVLDGIELSQQADYGESALRMMGLTEQLAPLVVLCGHGSSTTNNAYASALDCGACAGNHGGRNARILAAILNRPPVRARLADRGLAIPADTLFLAAEHDTTTDQVQLDQPDGLSTAHQEQLERLRTALANARRANAQARAKTFGLPRLQGDPAVRETQRRSRDWAEVRPEWGLARNAALIVGPRELTREVNLEGRCFLQSYDWQTDPTGQYLTTILTAPMVVAQWINSQYLFSTLDNVAYGSGSKVTQNVTGKLGVMQGNASDLMHGLPLQSVFAADGERYHEPLRLLTVVYAPRSMLDAIVPTQDVVKKLVGNGWVTVVCIDPSDNHAHLLTRDLKWQRAG